MHKCSRCQNTTDDYYYTKGRRDSMCKPCRKAYRKEEKRQYTAQYIKDHQEEQKERMKQWREDNREYPKEHNKRDPSGLMLRQARYRAKKQGVPCTITKKDIIIPQVCPVLGVLLQKNTPYAPSLDKVIPELGYVPGNVCVISRRANQLKSDGTLTELQLVLEYMQSHLDP